MRRRHLRSRRGSVPVEYVLLASFVAAIALSTSVQHGFASLLVRGGNGMDVGVEAPVGRAEAPQAAPPQGVPSAGDDGVVGDDDAAFAPADDALGSNPWSGVGTACDQGRGNGSEGCDPGNSNQGDPSRSNDEPGGTGRGRGR